MKKNFKLVIACIICGLLSFGVIGGDFSKTSDAKTINKVLAATNDDGVVGTANLNNTTENSAKVGDMLAAPEKGWKRYDDRNNLIKYEGAWSTVIGQGAQGYYNTTCSSNWILPGQTGGKVTFDAYTDKIRFIMRINSNEVIFKVDGVEKYKTNLKQAQDSLNKDQILRCEIKGLSKAKHKFEIINNGSSPYDTTTSMDAIDIDDTGYLVDPSAIPAASISLNKTTDNLIVGATDTLIATVKPDNATNKKVVWSSSDEKIATVDANGKVTAIAKGTATITAKVDGTDLKATCDVTVTEPNKGRAILEVVMSNSERKEYDLEMTEVQKFIDWYNGKTSPSYQIKINSNVKPFSNRTEYLAHDKISSFQVKEYTDSQAN